MSPHLAPAGGVPRSKAKVCVARTFTYCPVPGSLNGWQRILVKVAMHVGTDGS